jgi:2-polyprenyl-3-methyl-5-hydroxy-6-metoxy-1,4-benzoquinol methylase
MMAVASLVQNPVEQFEAIYADAQGDASRIPWADQRPNPALVNWLNAVAPSLIRSGARVVCVGCGLGDDARELMRRGYDVSAFDCSRTAVEWAKRLDPANARCYQQADLLNPPLKWKRRFDLVVEVNTIQSLPPEMHSATVRAIAELMSPHGRLLVICRGADEPGHLEDGPPWALTREELLEAATTAGLMVDGQLAVFTDDEDPPVQRMRALFRRA